MKVKPPSQNAVAAARGVLAEADVRHPREIQVEAIALRHGAMVLYGPLRTARASIVRTGTRAVICVDERARGAPHGRFTVAHELGHHLLHTVVDHFQQCDGAAAKRRGRDWAVEREANHFSAELLMPEAFAARLCTAPRPSLDDVEHVARTFRTSFEASAIRFVQLTASPCAFAFSKNGAVKWAPESGSFPGRIAMRSAVHPRSVAATLARKKPGCASAPREVPGEAWGAWGVPFLEHAIALGPEVGVLSWIVPA